MSTETEKLTAAMQAVHHVLHRIATSPEIARHMGHATEAYALLCSAAAIFDGRVADDVEEQYPPSRQPGEPSRLEQASLATLNDLQRQLCVELSVAPCVATEIIRYAERTGYDLCPYHEPAGEESAARERFACEVCSLFVDWALRGRPRRKLASY